MINDIHFRRKIINNLIFKMESEKFEIFIDDFNDVITVAKNICISCNSKWHQDYNQCVFCGSLNYQLFKCSKCGELSSITNSSGKKQCKNRCKDSKPQKSCINDKCPSNTDETIKKAVNITSDDVSVFNSKKGSYFVSQLWCLQCGHDIDKYITGQIKVLFNEEINELEEYLDKFDNCILVRKNSFFVANKNNIFDPESSIFKESLDTELIHLY